MIDSLNQNRPEPDALLNQAKKEGRGRLKVFLGMAPGVGKTYAMLQAGKQRKAEGKDVVIGIVESHGRKDTKDLIEGHDVLPRLNLHYRGRDFEEMDLQALIKRKPEIALVDELAHTNIEGSLHTKRYQDVEELLIHGIDVYTTLNVQHLESLNDIIERITVVKPPRDVINLCIEKPYQPGPCYQERNICGKVSLKARPYPSSINLFNYSILCQTFDVF